VQLIFLPQHLAKVVRFSIILSLLHSAINYSKMRNKICLLASNMLPHYLAKFECSTIQLYRKVIYCKLMQDCLFTTNITRDVKFCFLRLHRLIYSMYSKRPSSTRMLWVNRCVDDVLFNAAKHLAGAVAKYCIDVKWRQQHSVKQVHENLSNRNTS